MKLIISAASPFSRKARIVAIEKQLPIECIVKSPWADHHEVSCYNPLAKVPFLLMDDGDVLFDSRVIVEYLDRLSPLSRLLPQESRSLTRVKRWEALADGVSEATEAVFRWQNLGRGSEGEDWNVRQRTTVQRGLETMADQLVDKSWCAEESFTLADVALGCALGHVAFCLPEINWRTTYPNLARHYSKLSDRPSFSETLPVL